MINSVSVFIFSLADNAFTRAYINFLQQDDIFLFCEKFDGYVFVDNKGKCKFCDERFFGILNYSSTSVNYES